MMETSISSQFSQISIQTLTSPQGAESVAQATGQYAGEAVHGASESEKLADAAEELGMSHSEHAEADHKTLDERSIRRGRGANIEALTRISEYYEKLPDMPDDAKIQGLVDELSSYLENTGGGRGDGKPISKDAIFQALQKFDGDVTHQFAALEVMAEYFAGIDEAMDAAIEDARLEFERDDLARDVRAGMAIAKAAHDAAQNLETDPRAMRDAYRQMLREKKNMGQLFDDLASFDGTKKFDETLEVFLETAGQDIAAATPSTDPLFLNALLVELGKLKKLNTVYQLSGQQLEKIKRLIGIAKLDIDKNYLTSKLLHFASRPTASVADAMAMEIGLASADIATRLQVGNGLKSLYDMIPDDVLPTSQSRELHNQALLGWLSMLVDEEEKLIES